MDWVEAIKDVNFVGVIVAVISTFVVGMTWYAEGVFGKTWMKELGLKKKDLEDKDGMMKAMAHSAVASFITATVVAALMLATGTEGAADGAVFGAVVGFGIAMSSMVTHDVFSRKSMTLTQINGVHDIVKFAIIGAIIGGIGF